MSAMTTPPSDRWISCTDEGLRIRWYYLWGAKKIPYGNIKGVRRVSLSALKGKARLWGTSNPRYWASLDPGRRKKSVALILDLGRRVSPYITPDDPDAVAAAITTHTGIELTDGGDSPFI
jgi:hypothetical protein